MKYASRPRIWLALAALGSAVGAVAPARAEDALPDGIYRVRRAGVRRVEVAPVLEGERLLIHDFRYFSKEEAQARPQQLVVVLTEPDVLLELIEPARAVELGEGRFAVSMKLAPRAAAKLAELSGAGHGVTIALVVDDEIVTATRIRQPIPDGVLEVVDCRERACDHLVSQLADNVVRTPAAGGGGE